MTDYKDIYDLIISELKKEYPVETLEIWFQDTYISKIDDNNIYLTATSKLKIDVITRKYLDSIKTITENIFGKAMNIILILPEDENADVKENSSNENTQINTENSQIKTISASDNSVKFFNYDYTFDNFIVGTSNQFAHAACTAVARNPATDYNPLFLYSASGLGKTHLLNAIMNEISLRDKNCNIVYVKGEEFTNNLIDAINSHNQVGFREKYRKADVLLIDDIQFIAGKNSTQEEFFHTFDTLYESHKQIIITSDRPPKDLKILEERLKTRFEWGLIADIQPPDYELRIAIMKEKAKLLSNKELPEEVLAYIAENLKTNIREIEGAVRKVLAKSFLSGEAITLDMAKECLSAFVGENEPPAVTAERVVERVSKKYGVSTDDIYGRKRTKHIALARSVAIHIIREITDMSYPAIGKIFDRDYSTIIYTNQMIIDECSKNPLLDIEIKELIKEITE